MSDSVITNQIKEKISDICTNEKTLVVLKGIPLSVVDSSITKISLNQVVENKMGYFMSIYGKRSYVSYEEFLLLADFMIAQYKEIYILDNNIYMEQYPVEDCFPDEIRKGLLAHFEESENDENDGTYIGDIEEYISIFVGLKEYNGYLMGAYSTPNALSSNKIITVNIFDAKKTEITTVQNDDALECDLIEESDYIDFVKKLFSTPDELYVRVSNYTGDINRLKEHIALAGYYWKEYTDIYYVQIQTVENEFEHRPEYGEILKKYWGYDSYRNLPVYDMGELERGKKEVIQVSQENIISNLVQQVENCGEDKDFRDLFVTAPTGAGKSVMFQVPAIYLAEKYNLLTIVISPLIGLMNDQVKNLELKNYNHAKTINSDISPIIKQDIIDKVSDGQYHILYISPETLLSRSDVEQLIGDRTIGMIVIDEAHIVTTWGKQFRPDYWYLGDHIRKLRKKQIEKKQKSFVIATFTATAIYRGLEDMYTETINSLHMLSPITYLGYVKREDIDIVIDRSKKDKGERAEYELDKFEQIEKILKRAIVTNKKTLIYFPTVALIERCYEYLRSKHEVEKVAVYYGTLSKDKKQKNYEDFSTKNKLVMLATKAFGMGIDINDIELVVHFAPTGNVCDYIQEIGRAARREDLRGEAYYHYNPKDFKHINRLHGLSTIQHYQLIKVIEKIDELYQQSIQGGRRKDYTKRRNAMLLDAENFSYIFGSPISDEDNNINKVKTALLLIQKDFESKIGFSPINIRPIPMFSIGFFVIDPKVQERLFQRYPNTVEEIDEGKHICRVLLSEIWNKDYKTISFPKFKFMLYSKDQELELVTKYPMTSVLCVGISFDNDYASIFKNTWNSIKKFVFKKVQSSEHTAVSEIAEVLENDCKINKYKAQAICEVVIASMDSYRKNFAKSSSPIALEKTTTVGRTKYQFNVAVNSYFNWVENGFGKVERETKEGKLYLINDSGNRTKEYNVILGILEAMGCLTFEMLGGANSQLYIYINQIQALKNILNAPYRYNNRLLDTVAERHLISVKMLTYLYEGEFNNEEMWDLLEDYFLGGIPEKVKKDCKKEKPDMMFY
ncbi:MAG: ATP-dependent DNA helicase RecQ [Lachnospiraceae bacterium]|nr:ATP-dependent DNA helicase RecQ [Lachnospiraceae bacterium]